MTGPKEDTDGTPLLRERLVGLGLTHGVDPGLNRLVPLIGDSAILPLVSGTSGVYLWIAANGEAYVGQARDLRARLTTHRRENADFGEVAVRLVLAGRLDRAERDLARAAEAVFVLRNVKLVAATVAHRPLDEVVPREDQAWFVEHGNRPEWQADTRGDMAEQSMRRRALRRAFDGMPDGARLVRRLTRLVQAVVPRPALTEMRFWSVTFLPPTWARINVGQQEIATVEIIDRMTLHRVLSPKRFYPDDPLAGYITSDYEIRLDAPGLRRFLASPDDMRAWRERALWLMRHTSPLHVRSHCPWLYQPQEGVQS